MAAAAAAPARGQILSRSWEGGSLELGGYLRSLGAAHHHPDLTLAPSAGDGSTLPLPLPSRTTWTGGSVLRLTWRLAVGRSMRFEVHQRVQAIGASDPLREAAGGAGFGVTARPNRLADLSSTLLDREHARADHDIDRLSLTLFTGAGDVTVGRQAITWGVATLFPVADLWAAFSPFELDTESKPGLDAVRWLSYPVPGLEVDAVAAHRGDDGAGFGVRASLSMAAADVYVAGGRFWSEAMAMGGFAAPVGAWKVRGEVALPYDVAADRWQQVRATVGVDRLGAGFLVSAELHRNGIGAPSEAGYAAVLADARLRRGETYYLARYYGGALVSWSPGDQTWSFTASALMNLVDGSAAFTPVVTYDAGPGVRVSGGAVAGRGASPTRARPLASEYGLLGSLLFVRASVYF